MPRDAMPTGQQVEQAVAALGVLDDDSLADLFDLIDSDLLADAAVARWETETGWKPFLADAVTEEFPLGNVTRYFDPSGPNQRLPGSRGGGWLLTLPSGLLTVTSLHSGFSATSTGTALVSETDYRLRPLNAGVEGRPFTEIEMLGSASYGLGRSIRIIGRWGYSATVPDDAWQAILYGAAGEAMAEIRERVTGGMIEWKEADVSERYGERFLLESEASWERRWRRAVNRYKRISL